MTWFRKPKIQERDESRVEFLGEQDGEVERELKARFISAFKQLPAIQRAYLARIGFEPDAPCTVALCLVSDRHDPAILEAAHREFASIFGADTFLDMLFLTPAQGVDVARVCSAFYERLYNER